MINWYKEFLEQDQWGGITLFVLALFFGVFSVLLGIGIALWNLMGVTGAFVLAVLIYFIIMAAFPYLVTLLNWAVESMLKLSAQNVRKED